VTPGPDPGADGLEVEGLVVRYGGLVAVDGVSLHAPMGRITGLIGPNGAGKTTTFNACTGLQRPTAGTIRLDGRDVTHFSAPARAQLGLGRTFQRMELFESLPVAENVALGREARLAGSNPLRHLRGARAERTSVRDEAHAAMAQCGITELADRPVADLSTGQRRLVELARAVASGAALLLLDEPSSGLDKAETEAFGGILRRLVDQRGAGILLVEHDMALVMAVCAYIYVLDFGRLLFEGTPAKVSNSSEVRAAYLGSEAAAAIGA
jgi:ABC-type branched-subunit amino acid transport system ATPase component